MTSNRTHRRKCFAWTLMGSGFRGWLALWLGWAALSPFPASAYETRQLSDNEDEDWLLAVDNGQVLYLSDKDGDFNPDSLVLNDGTQTVTLATGLASPPRNAMLDQGQVVWEGSDGNDTEIYLYHDGIVANLTDNDIDDRWPCLSEGKVVWIDFLRHEFNGEVYYYSENIFLFDGAQTVVVTNGVYPWNVKIDHNQIVWSAWDGADQDIYLYREGVTTNLSDNTFSDWGPQIRDGQVLWAADSDGDNTPDRLFLYDGTQVVTLWTGDCREVSMAQGQVVWVANDGFDDEVYLYRDGQLLNLSDNDVRDDNPSLSEGHVIWRTDPWDEGWTWLLVHYDGRQSQEIYDWGWGWDGLIDHGQVVWMNWDGHDAEVFGVNLYVPAIEILPDQCHFGYVPLGQSVTQTFSVVNLGVVDLAVGTISLVDGGNLSSYLIVNDLCSGQSVAPGETNAFDVVFAPDSLWAKPIRVLVPSNDPDSPTNTVLLYGVGVNDSAAEASFQDGLARLRAYQDTEGAHDTNDLFAARSAFATAVAADSNHYAACVFEALSHLLTVVYDPEVGQVLTDFGVPEAGRDLLSWSAQLPETLAPQSPTSGEALAIVLPKLLSAVDLALDRLGHIPANWTGSLLIGPSELPVDNEVEVDAGDIQMVQGGLEAFKALLLVLQGYNLDFDFAYLDHADTPQATITLDGNRGDWTGIAPLLEDPLDASWDAPNADIRRVYTAMDDTYAYLMVEMYAAPVNSSLNIEINVNYQPGQQWDYGANDDLHLNVSAGGVFAWTNNLIDYPIGGVGTAWGDVLEIRLPLSALGNPSYFSATFVNVWPAGAENGIDPSDIPPPSVTDQLARFPGFATVTNSASIGSASNALIRALAFCLTGMDLIEGETDYQTDDFIVFDPEDADDTARTRQWLSQIQDSLNGRVSRPFAVELSQFLDLGDFFANPVSLRSLFTGGGMQAFLLGHGRHQVDFALSNLAGVNSTFNEILRPGESPLAQRELDVDYGDICMTRAYLTQFKALATILGAYDLNCDLVPFMEGKPLTKNTFLSAHPAFLILSNAALLVTASNLVPEAISQYLAGAQFIRSELDNQQDDLITSDLLGVEDAGVRTIMEGLRDSMTGVVFVSTADFYDYVHLSRFFASDYVTRAHLPAFDETDHALEGSFADPTFNGILPSNTQWRLARSVRLPHVDEDDDGMPDLWEGEVFGAATNGPSSDTDGDGMDNYSEYLAGTDPNRFGSVLKMDPSDLEQDGDIVIRWESVPYRDYRILRATNLVEGFQLIVPLIHATPPVNTYFDRSGLEGPRFYSIEVLPPQ